MAGFFQSYGILIAIGLVFSFLIWMVYRSKNAEAAGSDDNISQFGCGMGCCGGGHQSTDLPNKSDSQTTTRNESCH